MPVPAAWLPELIRVLRELFQPPGNVQVACFAVIQFTLDTLIDEMVPVFRVIIFKLHRVILMGELVIMIISCKN